MAEKHFGAITERLAHARKKLPQRLSAPITLIEEQLAAIARGDFKGALRRAAPDIELEIFAPPEFPFTCRARGTAALEEALRHNFGAVDDQKPVISDILGEGDVVVMLGTETGRIRETGAAYHVQFVHRFTFVEGALQNIRVIVARATNAD